MGTYERLADLPLTVESYGLEGLERRVSSDFQRRTTVVRLGGRGTDGVGEDVTYDAGDHVAFEDAGPTLPLSGSFTLDGFSRRLGELDLFPREPQAAASRFYRRWAFESAALDLALRQAGRSLAEVLDLDPAPIRFVVSLRLGQPPTAANLRRWLELYPGLSFKLDATSSWDEELIRELVAIGSIEAVDFKGAYKGTVVDQEPDAGLYARVARAFPDAWLEDPALTPETEAALAEHRERITWDAPIHSVEDVRRLPFPPRMLNIKPSRFGALSALCEAYDFCRERDIRTYGGGQFELGPGRGQIQYLAALLHPGTPNDIAPGGYNEPEPLPGLPTSPMTLRIAPTGFRAG